MRIGLLALALLLLIGPAPAAAQERPLIVGIVLSKTGLLADLGTEVGQGLALWIDEINAKGGLLGRRVELRQLDDSSEAAAARGAYERLIDEERADVLVGPLGSAATLIGAGAAERRRRVMLNATGMAQAVHKHRPRYVFQIPPSAQEHAANVLTLARSAGVTSMLLHAHGEGEGAAERVRQQAAQLGIAIAKIDLGGAGGYPGLIGKARAARIDAWIGLVPGHEAAEIVKALKTAAYAPRFFLAEGVAQPAFVREVGQDAEYALGLSVYEPGMRTPGNAEFVQAYRAKHKRPPAREAACAYAAGKVLEAAVRQAGSLEQEALREALAGLRTETVLGPHAVDETGSQTGAKPVVVQILKGRREVVWPREYASASPVLPYPAWSERKIIKR